jgi:hypothetical protein
MQKKKAATVEITPAASPGTVLTLNPADLERLLGRLVDARFSEILARQSDLKFEPFFRSKRLCDEIHRHQSVFERNRWRLYFERHGCLVCARRDVPHNSLGMCGRCYLRTRARLVAIERKFSHRYGDADPAEQMENMTSRARTAEELLGAALPKAETWQDRFPRPKASQLRLTGKGEQS